MPDYQAMYAVLFRKITAVLEQLREVQQGTEEIYISARPPRNMGHRLWQEAWKTEYVELTAGQKKLNQRCVSLKDEVNVAEQIRKSVYGILRQEQREQQSQKKQDMALYKGRAAYRFSILPPCFDPFCIPRYPLIDNPKSRIIYLACSS